MMPPIPIPSAKYSATGRKFYEPIGDLDTAPIASAQQGVHMIRLSLFGKNDAGDRVHRVHVTKESLPIGHCDRNVVDFRHTDIREAVQKYESLVDQYADIALRSYKLVTGRR